MMLSASTMERVGTVISSSSGSLFERELLVRSRPERFAHRGAIDELLCTLLRGARKSLVHDGVGSVGEVVERAPVFVDDRQHDVVVLRSAGLRSVDPIVKNDPGCFLRLEVGLVR